MVFFKTIVTYINLPQPRRLKAFSVLFKKFIKIIDNLFSLKKECRHGRPCNTTQFVEEKQCGLLSGRQGTRGLANECLVPGTGGHSYNPWWFHDPAIEIWESEESYLAANKK